MFTILRTAKIKSVGGVVSSAKHNLRTRETPNANPEKTPLNKVVEGEQEMAVVNALKTRLEKVDRKVRKDAVLALEYMITATPEFFKKSPKKGEEYLKDALAWVEKKHGRENVIQAVIHLDETTPHLHVLVVPIRKKVTKYTQRDTKQTTEKVVTALDAQHWIGGKIKLAEMQTNFTNEVGESFGLSRGVKGSKAKHEDIAHWYGANITAGGGVTNTQEPPKKQEHPYIKIIHQPDGRLGFQITSLAVNEIIQNFGITINYGGAISEPYFDLVNVNSVNIISDEKLMKEYPNLDLKTAQQQQIDKAFVRWFSTSDERVWDPKTMQKLNGIRSTVNEWVEEAKEIHKQNSTAPAIPKKAQESNFQRLPRQRGDSGHEMG